MEDLRDIEQTLHRCHIAIYGMTLVGVHYSLYASKPKQQERL
jgi:hypothetical protein